MFVFLNSDTDISSHINLSQSSCMQALNHICMCVCVRACVRACACVCVCVLSAFIFSTVTSLLVSTIKETRRVWLFTYRQKMNSFPGRLLCFESCKFPHTISLNPVYSSVYHLVGRYHLF